MPEKPADQPKPNPPGGDNPQGKPTGKPIDTPGGPGDAEPKR